MSIPLILLINEDKFTAELKEKKRRNDRFSKFFPVGFGTKKEMFFQCFMSFKTKQKPNFSLLSVFVPVMGRQVNIENV